MRPARIAPAWWLLLLVLMAVAIGLGCPSLVPAKGGVTPAQATPAR